MKLFNSTFKLRMALVALVVLLVLVVNPAYAMQAGETPTSPPTEVGLADVALLVATVALLKSRFGWKDNQAFGAAVVVGAVMAFVPLVVEQFPPVAPWLLTFGQFLKLVIFSAGGFSAVIDVGGKIAAKAAQASDL